MIKNLEQHIKPDLVSGFFYLNLSIKMKVFLNKKIPQVAMDILKENNLEIITSEIENSSHRE